jgi:FkbH-like protein
MILRKKYFASLRINWDSKPINIQSIADELNIGTDSMIFIDDNPAECELVKMQMPEVEVVNLAGDPDNYIEQLMKINSLQSVFITGEDLSRNSMHTADIKRKLEEETYDNLNDYFKSLDMRAEISINTESFISRISQLTQKTNQFNLTTKRYSNEEINKFVTSDNYNIYTLRLIDKYGDNGIVVVAIIEKKSNQWYIDSFLMSCRIIGRRAETALLNTIIEDARKENIKMLRGNFISTDKNAPAQEFYRMHNFIEKSNNYWELETPGQLKEHFIKIIRENHI